MKIVIGALIFSNFMSWIWLTAYADLYKRNETMTDTDRERNSNRYYEVKKDIYNLQKVVEKYIIEH